MDKQLSNTFFQLVIKQRWFIFLLIFVLGLLAIISLGHSQASMFIRINQYHHEMANDVFKVVTWMGDWPFTISVAFIALFFQFRYAILLVGSMLYTGLYTQVLKVIVQAPRPYVYFQEIKQSIYTLEYYTLENSLSFPSGHTTCVFSLSICLSYIFNSRMGQYGAFLMAVFVAFSRVYLAQHFFVDLMAGAIIGTFGGLHFIWLLNRTNWYHSPVLDSGFLR